MPVHSFRASRAKSIMMIAFFFTMPIDRIMPIIDITSEFRVAEHQCQQRSDTGRRQRGQDRNRVDVAFVENAQHDVDGDERARISIGGFSASESETLGPYWQSFLDRLRQAHFDLGCIDSLNGIAPTTCRGQVERKSSRRGIGRSG